VTSYIIMQAATMSQYAPVLPTDDEDDDEGDFSIVGSTRQPASYQWEQAKRRKLGIR